MRRKTEVKKKQSLPKWIYLSAGYFFLVILMVFHFVNYFLRLFEVYTILPNYYTKLWQETLVLLGAPLILIVSFIISFKYRRFCGALLIFGSALISAGIAFESGYFLKIYLLKMAVVGLPQILAGIFFLKSGK
ncbi:MAG: hypothetical protein GYA35_03105 [Thermoanaerobaculaceae bacterium]|nr:hypothetical protein [Thermoanaerobaculaceae bacterium]